MGTLKLKQTILYFLGKYAQNGRLAFWLSYVHNRHRIPNFKKPSDISEIWIKRVLDGKINEISYLADKLVVRQYVRSKGLESILTPLLGVYEKGSDIDFDSLPNSFAIKANFGAGHNIICTEKSKLSFTAVREQVDEWLKPVVYSYSERHYNLIPKKIICEEFINDGSGKFPVDYKFMCLKGKVHCVLVCYGRENGHADYLPYSVGWQPMYDYYRSFSKDIKLLKCPENLVDMISVAEKLAEDIDLVRVDLYSNGSKIWFGEMTLTPSGCIFHRWSNKAIRLMGEIYLNENK